MFFRVISFPFDLPKIVNEISFLFVVELSSGPKGRRAEHHNYRARIEIEKTMRLSFHGHRG